MAVDAGTDFSMALTADGQVLSWGSIAQQEVPDAATNCVMIAAGYTHALALTADHTVLGWGDGSGGKLNGISGLSNIESIGAGEAGSVFVNSLDSPMSEKILVMVTHTLHQAYQRRWRLSG